MPVIYILVVVLVGFGPRGMPATQTDHAMFFSKAQCEAKKVEVKAELSKKHPGPIVAECVLLEPKKEPNA
jgi:hypothetical protein